MGFQVEYLTFILPFFSNKWLRIVLDESWLNWFHFLILVEGPLAILMGYMIFMSPLLYAIRTPNTFFTRRGRLWNSLGCFLLKSDQNGFPFLELIETFFPWAFSVFPHPFGLLFLGYPCFVVTVQSCMVGIPI